MVNNLPVVVNLVLLFYLKKAWLISVTQMLSSVQKSSIQKCIHDTNHRSSSTSLVLSSVLFMLLNKRTPQFLLTLCLAKWTLGSQVQQDWVHTGRRVSLHWPRPLSEAPGGSGSCKVAASTRGWCPAALRVALPPPEYRSWKRAGGDWRSRCCCRWWWPDPALEEW